MNSALTALGLSPFFTAQLTAEDIEHSVIGRIMEVQRSHVIASDGENEWHITLGSSWYHDSAEQRPTVGDWVLLDKLHEKIVRLLERKSVFKRVAAGSKVEVQLIAANIDTLFIVTSCNNDFNESRLERYLALASEAGVDPVVVITKADLSDVSEQYRDRVAGVHAHIPVEIINALEPDSMRGLCSWVSDGSTVALVGSSGVGKSTIVNTLSGHTHAATAAIRDQDAKGRHTTSYRALHQLPGGGLLLDVPGMRELKVAHLESGLDDVFTDIDALSNRCKFRDCQHIEEPGCAVREAIDTGLLDVRRLTNYQKLLREDARHSSTLAEQRQRDREFGKMVKQHVKHKHDHESS